MSYFRSLDHVTLALHELKEGNSHKAVENLLAAVAEPDFEMGLDRLVEIQTAALEDQEIEKLNEELKNSACDSTDLDLEIEDLDSQDDLIEEDQVYDLD